jgi:hypothetical protein
MKTTFKFGIENVSSDLMDIGIKLKGAEPTGRFKAAGSWNAIVTHRVQVTKPNRLIANILGGSSKRTTKQKRDGD